MKELLKGDEPSLATCRSSQQTALWCCGQNPWCWTDKEKAQKMGQVWVMEMNVNEPLMKYWDYNPLSKLLLCYRR